MEGQSTGTFTWVIENFTELEEKQYSPEFIVGCCKWRLLVYPKGFKKDFNLSLFLGFPNSKSLPSHCRRHARVSLSLVNQLSNSQTLSPPAFYHWYSATESSYGYYSLIPLHELKNPEKGFVVDNRVIVEAELKLLEVQGDLDILEKPTLTSETETDRAEESSLVPTGNSSSSTLNAEKAEICEDVAGVENPQEPLEDYEIIETDEARSDDAAHTAGASKSSPAKTTELMIQTVDVNGFLVPDTQAEQVKSVFEKHPDLASNFQIRNRQLRTEFMSVLLDLIETLRQSPQDITEDDLSKECNTLIDLENVGLNVCWLKARFEEVSKKKERAGGSQVEELEKQFEKLKLVMSYLEAQVKKEKENIEAARISLSFSDFIS